MQVTCALNEADDAKVLRLIFSFKRLVSIDGWFEHMLLPYTLTDMVNVLVGEFRSNLDFAEIIANKTTHFSESFAASVRPMTIFRMPLLCAECYCFSFSFSFAVNFYYR
jgi:hypothetical protein